jgi:hypothetical protein
VEWWKEGIVSGEMGKSQRFSWITALGSAYRRFSGNTCLPALSSAFCQSGLTDIEGNLQNQGNTSLTGHVFTIFGTRDLNSKYPINAAERKSDIENSPAIASNAAAEYHRIGRKPVKVRLHLTKQVLNPTVLLGLH